MRRLLPRRRLLQLRRRQSRQPQLRSSYPARLKAGRPYSQSSILEHRGYLNSEDVSQLQGFNFKNADKNNDGKLDATEFNTAWAIYSGTLKS